jgi:small subunit ribosomal protein S16
MAVKIRLQRQGKPKRPFYKVVAAVAKSKRDGEPIEVLGQYDPMAVQDKMRLDKTRLDYWLSQGAKPTQTVANLISKYK